MQNCEWRLSIYGKSPNEWNKLAKWIIENKLFSHNVRWLIQVPRLYDVYKNSGVIDNFEDIIRSKQISYLNVSIHNIDTLQISFNLYLK